VTGFNHTRALSSEDEEIASPFHRASGIRPRFSSRLCGDGGWVRNSVGGWEKLSPRRGIVFGLGNNGLGPAEQWGKVEVIEMRCIRA